MKRTVYSALFVTLALLFASLAWSFPAPQARNGFSNMNVTTEYSELLKEKNARNDSLLPALDGDKAFAEVLRLNPNFWSLGSAMDKEGSLVTKLNAQIVFIDGIREDPFCELVKGSKSDASTWNVRIGVDFVSGGSNTVHIHVQQCLDYVRDQLGYAIKQGDKIVVIPPKKVLDKLRESEIPDAIDLDLQQTLLKAHEEVELDGKCPKNIEAYIILMNVYNQVKDKKMDYVVINDQLNKNRNGAGRVQSCAFSREWNKRYQESASFECDIDNDRCLYRQEKVEHQLRKGPFRVHQQEVPVLQPQSQEHPQGRHHARPAPYPSFDQALPGSLHRPEGRARDTWPDYRAGRQDYRGLRRRGRRGRRRDDGIGARTRQNSCFLLHFDTLILFLDFLLSIFGAYKSRSS